MQKNEFNLSVMVAIFVTSLIVSNVLASKVLEVFTLEIPAAVVAYPWTFLMTDVIGEVWGKKQAQKTVWVGIGCQILSLAMIYSAIYLPPASYMVGFQDEYKDVLGTTARMVFASLAGFAVSQTWDVCVFHRLKDDLRFREYKWLRNNVSTITSQVLDTAIFITIAFWGVVPDLLWMVFSQLVIKWCIALADTVPFYCLTKKNRYI